MQLKYIILYVEDVAQSLRFYNRAFGFDTNFIHDAGDYGELSTGSTILAFSSLKLMSELGKQPTKPENDRPTFELAFETEDVQSSVNQAVDCGATLVQSPEQKPWGQTVAYVSDENGFLIEICTAVEK